MKSTVLKNVYNLYVVRETSVFNLEKGKMRFTQLGNIVLFSSENKQLGHRHNYPFNPF